MRAPLALAIAATLAGCSGAPIDGPPAIRYGEESCAQCGMLISDAAFAAALVAPGHDAAKFDDIGCLLAYRAARAAPAGQVWVHDMETGAWLDAEAAVFVRSQAIETSMGSGLAAVASEAAAVRLAERVRGEVVRFNQLNGSGP